MEQVTVDEAKEADIASRQASHRISRGIHNKVFIDRVDFLGYFCCVLSSVYQSFGGC